MNLDVTRAPDAVAIWTDNSQRRLKINADGSFADAESCVSFEARGDALEIRLQSAVRVRAVQLRWRAQWPRGARFLGDAWERGYGDLEWRGAVPERVMPWYCVAFDGQNAVGWGVQTAPKAFCHWKTDASGVSLTLDVRSGGVGVELGERTLEMATIRCVSGQEPFVVARALCRVLCADARLPAAPVYGGNDWYYAYGDNSRASIVRDARTMSELAPDGENRPWMVIDDGWQECHYPTNGGPWNVANAKFGDMTGVARDIKECGARPGLWFRPLLSAINVPRSWRFAPRQEAAPEGLALDPSVPECLQIIGDDVRRFRDWGFELVKHDFSSFDIFWKWGFEWPDPFGAADAKHNPWSFADKSRTSAEIIRALYQAMRDAAGDSMMLLGCNTVGHLGAGLFEIQRTGDDTSGREWERTRKMGVNTLAFRQPQHDAFFAVDADCVGLTAHIPWELNRQWLDLLARSGTPLFVSAAPDALGAPQKMALRAAFARASQRQKSAEPLDWLDTTCPTKWRCDDEILDYSWLDAFWAEIRWF